MIFISKISRRYKVEALKSTFQLYVGNSYRSQKVDFSIDVVADFRTFFEHVSGLDFRQKRPEGSGRTFLQILAKLRSNFNAVHLYRFFGINLFPLFATFQNDIYIFGTYYLINFNFFALDKFLFDIFIHSLTPFVFLSSSVFFCLCVFFSFRFPIYLHERLRSPVR